MKVFAYRDLINLNFKIFAESPDEFTLVLFGSERTHNAITSDQNIYFCEEEMQKAKIDWLRLIDKEIKPSSTARGDCMCSISCSLCARIEFHQICFDAELKCLILRFWCGVIHYSLISMCLTSICTV